MDERPEIEHQFINRDAERAELRSLLMLGRPQLALLYGRRRVGKTHLLTCSSMSGRNGSLFTSSRQIPLPSRIAGS